MLSNLFRGEVIARADKNDGCGRDAARRKGAETLQRPPDGAQRRGRDQHARNPKLIEQAKLKLALVQRREWAAERLDNEAASSATRRWLATPYGKCRRNCILGVPGRQGRRHRFR